MPVRERRAIDGKLTDTISSIFDGPEMRWALKRLLVRHRHVA